MVAKAAPLMPHLQTATNKRASPTFTRADTAKNQSGTAEFPSALSRRAKSCKEMLQEFLQNNQQIFPHAIPDFGWHLQEM